MEPTLASSLWDPDEAFEGSDTSRLPTGCQAIDTALQGGFDCGTISCISADLRSGGSEISQAVLISHLLSSDNASATILDTGQAVDVRRLYQAVLLNTEDETDKDARAKRSLGRLRIMKAFDFIGLSECVQELREVPERANGNEVDQQARAQAPRGTVPDSQDEEEMLDDASPPPDVKSTVDLPSHSSNNDQGGLLIIDNIMQVAAPLLKNNHAQGQALITAFMRSLSHLTRSRKLCTILLNGAISNKHTKDETQSAFSSCTVRPALGSTFASMIDLHLLVHQVPSGAVSTTRAKSTNEKPVQHGASEVNVLEVLQDCYHQRYGRWAAFAMDDNGVLTDVAQS